MHISHLGKECQDLKKGTRVEVRIRKKRSKVIKRVGKVIQRTRHIVAFEFGNQCGVGTYRESIRVADLAGAGDYVQGYKVLKQ